MNKHIENSINEMKDLKFDPEDAIKKATGETPVNDNPSDDKEQQEDILGLTLFNQIVETSVKIMQTKEVEKALVTIGEKLDMDEETLTSFINLMSICMTNSAHQAILFYDDLLKKELTKQFDNTGRHINLGKADMEGVKTAIQIQQKRLGKLENDIILSKLKKENGIGEEGK